MDGNAYNDIEDLTNALTTWELLETTFKPCGLGFLNNTFQKLHSLTLPDCKGSADYVLQFCNIVNELRNFSRKLKLDENWLIYLFLSNLGPEHASYFETYAQEHDPFDDNGNAKFTLSSAMHHFQNTIRNPSSKTTLDRESVALVAANMPAQQSIVQDGAQIGTSNSRVLTIQKTIKYCTHCKRDFHTKNECRLKHPNLPSKPSNKPSQKRRQGTNNGINDGNKDTSKLEKSSYFTKGQFVTFMATQELLTSMFNNVWVWDCGCSQHVTPDRSAFVDFRKLSNQKPVKGLAGSLISIGIGTVCLYCTGINGPRILQLCNVLYIPEATVSLISQGQIHRQGHHLKITSNGIKVGTSGIIVKLASNNLYLIHLSKISCYSAPIPDQALTAINGEAVRM